jgi:signal transduction histidine kinase/ligand-binding sensor domain-containing protein
LPYLAPLSKWLHWCAVAVSLLLLAGANVHANPFQKRLIDNNLPNVGIYGITQDSQGFLWLASTNTGLVQFDGYDFQHYPILNKTLTQLHTVPDIGALTIDYNNNLWAGSWGYGLARVNAKDDSIKVFTGAPNDMLASPFVQTLFKDAQQRIWIGTTKGINRYSDKDGLELIDTKGLPEANPRVWGFAQTPDGAMWVATSTGLYRWHDTDGFTTALYPHGVDSSSNEVRVLHVVGNDLWVGTRLGVLVYRHAEQKFTEIAEPPDGLPWINTMLLVNEHTLLVGTFGGIYAINPQTRQFVPQYQQQWAELPNINIRSLYVGRSDVLWVGTRENGLFFKTVSSQAFQNSADPALLALQQSLDAPVLTLLAEEDSLWLGQNGRVIQFQHGTGMQHHIAVPGRVNSIKRAPDNTLWIGADEGLFQLAADGSLSRLTTLFTQLNLPAQNARDIKFIGPNQVLINLWGNGSILYDQVSGQLQHFLADVAKTTNGDAVQGTAITERYIWLVSRLSGIYLVNRQDYSVQHLSATSSAEQLAARFSGQLTCIAAISGNSVAICTEKGLLRLSEADFSPQLFNSAQGLDAEFLVGAFAENDSAVWLSSTQGLYLLEADNTVTHFSMADGLQSDNLMFGALAQDRRHLYLGSDAGLELVNSKLLRGRLNKLQDAEPMPVVSNVLFEQKQVARSLLRPLTSLDVPPKVSRIEFQFSSFDFNAPERNKYLYKLQGYDEDWQLLKDGRVATYTNLSPGKYVLQMRASNSRAQFGEQISQLDIKVIPHWWQRTDMQALLLFGILCLLSWYIWQRLARVNLQNKELLHTVDQKNIQQHQLEAAVAERTDALQQSLQQLKTAYYELQKLDVLKDQFISTVSHELRTPLTSITGALGLVLSGSLSDDEAKIQQLLLIASSNSKRLTLLINDLLDLEKLAANKMHFELAEQPLHPIVQRAVAENSTYSHERHINLHYHADPDAINAIAMVDDHRLLQVLANLLSNAIKFSPAQGRVDIRLYVEQGYIKISIADQGPGIAVEFQPRIFQRFSQASSGNAREHGGTGLGLALSRELMHAMHGDISFVSIPAQGCTFYLHLPIQPQQDGNA